MEPNQIAENQSDNEGEIIISARSTSTVGG